MIEFPYTTALIRRPGGGAEGHPRRSLFFRVGSWQPIRSFDAVARVKPLPVTTFYADLRYFAAPGAD
jgi:hypothetical protein